VTRVRPCNARCRRHALRCRPICCILSFVNESGPAVFLSYASEDADVAQRICAALRAAGIEVWFDQSELRGGDAWDSAIRKQIKACTLFIPLISATHRLVRRATFGLNGSWR
jgi:hypothetical protein